MSGRDQGTRAMRLLAVRLIERRDPNDTIVLGDAMIGHGIHGLLTGRSRPVVFHTDSVWRASSLDAITTPHEREIIFNARSKSHRFTQQGFEVIYNVDQFAKQPTEKTWAYIWTMWITPERGTYRALVDAGLLPRSIRFGEIDWRSAFPRSLDINLAYDLDLIRIPKRRKRPVHGSLFRVLRDDTDNPHAGTGNHFTENRDV